MNDKLQNLNSAMKNVFKGFFVLIIFFFLFFAVNLFISIQNKDKSAYSVLSAEYEKSQPKLQDTRVHNWSELDKKK
jgi:dolichyl-phosphate-mannose--protein O-mannosyl transferase